MKTQVRLIANPGTEAQHQKNLIRWSEVMRSKYPELRLLYHIPNGGSRDPIEGKHLKEAGVKPGVPDLCLPVSRGGYHALYIEMKTESGRETPEQRWWREELSGQGYFATVAHGWESAARIIEWYLCLKAKEDKLG